MDNNFHNIIPSSQELELAKEQQIQEILEGIRERMLKTPNENMWAFWYLNTNNNSENLKEVAKRVEDMGYETELNLRTAYSESGHELLVFKKGCKPPRSTTKEIVFELIKMFAIVGGIALIIYFSCN